MAEKGWVREHASKTVVGSIVGAIMAALIAWTVPSFRSVLVVVGNSIGDCFGWLGSPVTIARWHYWLLATVATLIVVTLIALSYVAWRTKEAPAAYRSYLTDVFFGIRWRWQYQGGAVVELQCYCRRCDRILRYSERYGSTDFFCQACDNSSRHFDEDFSGVLRTVRIEIEHHLRSIENSQGGSLN